MILSSNETLTGFKVHTRVVDRSMAELQFVGVCPSCQPKDLGSEADAHYWKLSLHQISCGLYGSDVDSRVSGAVADDDSPWIHFKDLVGRKVVRNADNTYPLGEKAAHYPVFG